VSERPPTPHPNRTNPVVARLLTRFADALGPDLRSRVVFIGASLLPLLETEVNVLSSPRPTRDVDAVIATRSYTQKAMLDERLRARGFRNAMDATHMDRWRAPDGTLFDLVACGTHSGGTGNANDEWVVANAVETTLPPRIRHASAVGLLLLKCGAYRDRGAMSPATSKDLADIAALIATRRELEGELRRAPDHIQRFVGHAIDGMLTPRCVGAIRAHIEDREPLIARVTDIVIAQLTAMLSAGRVGEP
jgi:hypothetical protein